MKYGNVLWKNSMSFPLEALPECDRMWIRWASLTIKLCTVKDGQEKFTFHFLFIGTVVAHGYSISHDL